MPDTKKHFVSIYHTIDKKPLEGGGGERNKQKMEEKKT